MSPPLPKDPERRELAKIIGERLRTIRKILRQELPNPEESYTQELLANATGISPSAIKACETHVSVPDSLFLLRLYKGTGFNPAWVLTGAEPMRLARPDESPAESTPAPSAVRLTLLRESQGLYTSEPSLSRQEAARIVAKMLLEFAGDS